MASVFSAVSREMAMPVPGSFPLRTGSQILMRSSRTIDPVLHVLDLIRRDAFHADRFKRILNRRKAPGLDLRKDVLNSGNGFRNKAGKLGIFIDGALRLPGKFDLPF